MFTAIGCFAYRVSATRTVVALIVEFGQTSSFVDLTISETFLNTYSRFNSA